MKFFSNKKKEKKSKTYETIETIVVALVLAIFIRATVAEARYIPSESMVPTLLVRDRLIVEKISNYTGTINRGDIVVFYPPFEEAKFDKNSLISKTLKWLGFTSQSAYIKRVIGLPGEIIEIKDGYVFINGEKLDESSYIKEKPIYEYGPIKIPDNEVFVLGDNRNNSADSHVWGTLPIENIIGHAIIRFWPPQRIGTLN
ncbi:MAG: signal peptidase I [Candidatus Sericytochromatia bacterium]|nr:MAG: signal peptidase I [Candidatus Sericytochromatia bacterium]